MSTGGTGNVPNYLKTAASVESGFQFDDDPKSSAFHKQGYYTTTPHIDARYLIKPQTTYADYGNQVAVMRIEKDHDFAGLCELQIPSQALVGLNATYLRRANWFGFSVIKEIHIKHNTHTLQSWQGDTMFPHYMLETTADRRQLLDPLIGGDYSPVDREIMAERDAVFRVPLDLFAWWCKNTHTYMNTQSYSDEIRIYVSFYDKSEWVETDSTNAPTAILGTVSIRSQTYELGLVLEQHHVVESERTYHHTQILNTGVLEPFVDYVNVGRQTIDPNQDNLFKVDMKNLNMPVRHICFVVRRATDVSTAYNKNLYNLLDVVGFGMTGQSSGGEFVPFTPGKYNMTRIRDQYHSSRSESAYPIYFKSWTYTPEDHINELGSLHMGNINNPQLVIYIGQAIGDSEARDVSRGHYPLQAGPEQLVVDIYAQTFNLRQEFGGTPKKTFG